MKSIALLLASLSLVACAVDPIRSYDSSSSGSGGGSGGGGGSGSGTSDASFDVEPASCSLSGSLQLSSGAAPTYNACRLRFNASTRIYTWQLIAANSEGSWLSPGAGWITLSFNADSPENTTLPLARSVSEDPASVSPSEVVFVFTPSAGMRAGGTGSVQVGANAINTPGGAGSALAASFNVKLTTGEMLSGSVSTSIAAAASAGSGSSGGGGGSSGGSGGGSGGSGGMCFDYSQCDGLKNECANGGQGACYCAAACVCAAACDSSCQQQNHQSAVSVNYSCSY